MGLLPFDLPDAPRDRPEPLTVSQASRLVVRALDDALPSSMRVRGEISGLSIRNGHWFFTLRDADASLDAVMWSSQTRVNAHRPEDGQSVLVTGRIGHWARGGRTRFEARKLALDGAGNLRAAFVKLCNELRALGWFDDAHKQPLPSWPSRVAVVTSSQGAAVSDVIATARSRFPATSLLIVDVRVQGASAASEVSEAITRLDRSAERLKLDAIIVTRGGGSAEDLEAFNQREVAQAVHDASTPVVAAIGHESDTSIIELVADARASTPTHAVTLLLPDHVDVLERFDSLSHRLSRASSTLLEVVQDQVGAIKDRIARSFRVSARHRHLLVDGLSKRLSAARPDRIVEARRGQISQLEVRLRQGITGVLSRFPSTDDLSISLARSIHGLVNRANVRIEGLDRAMSAVDPLAVLERGYSLTMDSDGRAVRSSDTLEEGMLLETRLANGVILSRVESTRDTPDDSDTVEP